MSNHQACRSPVSRGLLVCWTTVLVLAGIVRAAEPAPKKVVLIAGTVHQGAGGHPPGTHEYELSARLLKHALQTSPNAPPINAEVHLNGWPRDERTLDDADTIVVLSDGADRNTADHPLLVGDRLHVLGKQMARGCGLVVIHWTVFVPRAGGGEQFLDWIGGHFDYESGPAANKWFSKIQTAETTVRPATPAHPICRGLKPFQLREEYYYNIRFRERDQRLSPILATPIPNEPREQTVAWAVDRTDGGRGFGFTGGHFFDNWGVENFRRMVLNAIVWTAKADVPAGGIQSSKAPQAEPTADAVDEKIQALIVTGHQHPAHLWRETTVALQESLLADRRMQVTVVTDPEFLATKNLAGFDVVLLNYCNWQRNGLSAEAQGNFLKYLRDGGGLAIIHFSNGAFHNSLPETPASDWPEYRAICRRVWDHAAGRSSHDPFGRFQVEISADHPITQGMNSFETIDELYCNQAGDLPIEVLATARSTVTGRDEPMAFVYSYGKGRVFQTVLGHAAESIRVPAAATLIRRGTVWAADRPQRAVEKAPPAVRTGAPKLVPEGRFGAALDPRQAPAWAARQADYDRLPLTVECWTRLKSSSGFNILVASNPKESADHWELYSYAGGGELSLYMPGCVPAEIRSGTNIVDDRWHHVAATIEPNEVRLFVDGRQVHQAAVKRPRSGGPHGPLYFGGIPQHNIGCDGWIDEVRLSHTARGFDAVPGGPPQADGQTVSLWHFDSVDGQRVDDAGRLKNPAVAGLVSSAGPLLARHVADPRLELISIDASPDESFLSMRCDTRGQLFVGGREALFVYEPDGHSGYGPRQLLYRFPPDTWITDVDFRGDDLYVMTNAALYLFERGRIVRENLRPRRLLWGSPVDLHVTWHGLAWGPEGDLYFSSGDPLLNYGDFQQRPDHWGHWTIFGPEGAKVPYTGQGGFFRCRPDGSRLQVVAGGTRGAVGIAFDRRWNLFSNDNDHESLADRYSPARLLHVAPRANFFWPRGWIASMSPERSDLLEVVNTQMGREAPVGQTYYDDAALGPAYRDSLLVARWGQRRVDGFSLKPRGASYQAELFPLLVGDDISRPVGVGVGRGGRVFVALSYMAGNEWSPKYPSELVMIAPADNRHSSDFDPYDAPSAEPARLWRELAHDAWSRRLVAHQEILRRDGTVLSEAVTRLRAATPGDHAMIHLIWLAAASGQPTARETLMALARHDDSTVRVQAVRALVEFHELRVDGALLANALVDSDPQVRHAAVVGLFDRKEKLPGELLTGPAVSDDTYLRQVSAMLLAQRAGLDELESLLASSDAKRRLAGVLAAGFRLTIPPAISELPAELPLKYESGNALFVVPYAEGSVDLKALGRVGSFTIAQRWSTLSHAGQEQRLADALAARLDDADPHVAEQAGYFLNLLNDPPLNDRVARATRNRHLRRLAAAAPLAIDECWVIGPFDDGQSGFDKGHPPEQGAIDLTAAIPQGSATLEWRSAGGTSGPTIDGLTGAHSSYYYFRLQSLEAQTVLVDVPIDLTSRLWHNGRLVDDSKQPLLKLEPGSNDLLLRVAHSALSRPLRMVVRSSAPVTVTIPEKLGLVALAERLKSAGADAGTAIGPEFLRVDWGAAVKAGDVERGRKLFSADGLGCAKCHAVLPSQKGGGGPSLAGALGRLTVSHVVESVLLPSKQVAPVFGTTSITTDEGQTFAGLLVEETDEQIVLLLPTAARQAIARRAIEDRKLQPLSPMPAGLVKTPEELRDLLAYLFSPQPKAP